MNTAYIRGRPLNVFLHSVHWVKNVAGCVGLYIRVLCGDGRAPLFLSFCSLLLSDGPRLDLPAAEYGEEESTADVDPS